MLSHSRFSRTGVFIWLLTVAFFLYEYFARTVIGTYQPAIASILNIDILKFALVSSTAYSLIFGLVQFPLGVFLDRKGLRSALLMGTLFCALGCAIFAFANSFGTALLARTVMGFGSAFGYLCVCYAIYEYLPRQYSGGFIGLSQMLGTLGPIAAAGPMMLFAQHTGHSWRLVFAGLAVMGVLLAFYSLVKISGREKRPPAQSISINRKEIVALLKSAYPWWLGLFCGANYFAIEYLTENNGRAFMMLHGYSAPQASFFISAAWVGFAIGCPLIGWVSDKIGRRKPVMIVAAILSCLAAYLFVYPPSARWIPYALFFLGLTGGAQGIGYAVAAESCHRSCRAAAMGVLNALTAALMATFSPMIGWILRRQDGTGPVTVDYFTQGFSWLVILTGISALVAIFFIDEPEPELLGDTAMA